MKQQEYAQRPPTERSPLISSVTPDGSIPQQSGCLARVWQSPSTFVLWMLGTILLLSLGDQWAENPQLRVFESVICYQYYEKVDSSKIIVGREAVGPGAIGGVDEMLCKVDAVQGDLAMLRGWQQLFDAFPSLLLAIPVGYAADRFGRRPFVLAGLVAFELRMSWMQIVTWFWQAFDVRVSWLSALFGAIGGGPAVTSTLAFVVLADITPEADRASVFLRAGAFNLLASLIMPPLAAALMEINPWIPMIGGNVLQLLSVVMFAVCPETLNYSYTSSAATLERSPTLQSDDASSNEPRRGTQDLLRKIRKAMSFLTKDWRVPALILPFMIHMVVALVSQLLLQYLSKRYGLKLSAAILIATVRTGVIVLLLFIILPYISKAMMRRFNLSASRKDLYLARISAALLAVGWTLVGLSPNIPTVTISLAISSLGFGTALLLRSFLTSLLPKHHIARVYSMISFVDSIGAIVGMPLLAGLFKRGLALGGMWIGLPFYFIGMVAATFALLLFAIGLRKGEDEESSDDCGE